MSDAANYHTALDPERPWITDEQQLPANMNWLSTLLNPTGKSPTLHFTRAWTLLFMLQLACVFGISFAIGIVSLTGADTAGASLFNQYLTAIVFIVTTIMSFNIHCRRLNDAGKWSIWAFLVLLPLLAAFGLFAIQLQQKAAAYDELYAERAVYLADPDGWEERKRDERRQAQAEEDARKAAYVLPLSLAGQLFDLRIEDDVAAGLKLLSERANYEISPDAWESSQLAERRKLQADREATEAASGEREQGGRRGNRGDDPWDGATADKPLPSQEEFILRPNIGVFQQVIMPLSAVIMLWSLLWVARAPFPAKPPIYQPVSMIDLFISFSGRIGRKQFWMGRVLSILTALVVLGVCVLLGFVVPSLSTIWTLIAVVSSLLFLWCFYAIDTKRVHDLGYSIRALIKFDAVCLLLSFSALAVQILAPQSSEIVPIWSLVLFVLFAALWLIGFIGRYVVLGAFGPEKSDNVFGAAPSFEVSESEYAAVRDDESATVTY